MTQDILITPNSGEPQILFRGSGVNDTSIELNVLSSYQSATGSGTALIFEGTQGQLFGITDNLSSGTIFSVGDIGGLPLIEVDASGDVKLAEYGRYVGVGTGVPQYTLDVFGQSRFESGIIIVSGTPSPTTNVLYNPDGSLYFNGSAVNTDTTYSAGTGLTLDGTTFHVTGAYSSWTIADGNGNSEAVANGDTIYISGVGTNTITYDTGTNIISVSGASTSPGGSDTQVQYNNSGSFGGMAGVVWNDGTSTLTVTSQSSGITPLTITAASGQTENIQVWQNESGIDKSWVNEKGNVENPVYYAETDAATITFDMKNGLRQYVTLGGNRTLAESNMSAGSTLELHFVQDGPGSRTVTWWSNITWIGGAVPTLSTVPYARDVVVVTKIDGSDYIGAHVGNTSSNVVASYYEVSYATGVNFDLTNGEIQYVSLSGNPTLSISNDAVGSRLEAHIIQGTGNNTVTWWSGIQWEAGSGGGNAPTLSTASGALDMIVFRKISSTGYLGAFVGSWGE